MGNGVSINQGNLPSYGIGDVSDSADRKQHDWSQLAETPIIEQPSSALWSPLDPYVSSDIGTSIHHSMLVTAFTITMCEYNCQY